MAVEEGGVAVGEEEAEGEGEEVVGAVGGGEEEEVTALFGEGGEGGPGGEGGEEVGAGAAVEVEFYGAFF